MRRWMGIPVAAVLVTACVTINVYFPAAEAREVGAHPGRRTHAFRPFPHPGERIVLNRGMPRLHHLQNRVHEAIEADHGLRFLQTLGVCFELLRGVFGK